MIRARHTPGFDPQQAAKFRGDRCRAWVQRRVRTGQPVIRVAGEARLTCRELHGLEDGELQTDEDGWRELDAALDRLTSGGGDW